MPNSGATPSQNPNINAISAERRQLIGSPPKASAVRKLSRLRVNPRTRRLPIIWSLIALPVTRDASSRVTVSNVSHSGSAKANSALPWPAPSIPGRNPSVHAPHPVGTAMYCRPSTL